jgi:predicted transposase/invertase (TIGR01784 family)
LYICPKYVAADTPEPYREWLLAIADSLDEEVDETQYHKTEIQHIFELIARYLISPQEGARMKDEYSLEQIQQDRFEKGLQQKALETATKMLAKGYDLAEIAELTGLSIEELKNLKM